MKRGDVNTDRTRRPERWIARVTPSVSTSLEALLDLPLGLDVWERDANGLIVAATEAQLDELERRRLARVERLSTAAEYAARWRGASDG